MSRHYSTLTSRQMDWMVDRVGPYPFDLYGVLVADQIFVYALETQTLSLHPALLFDPEIVTPENADQILLHELAHQWYGDSVAPATWSDLWLNEGHATWYENTYAAEFHGLDFEAFIRDAYANGDQWRADFGPVALPSQNDFDLFSPNVYEGGATVLYALRQVIGDRTFRELERRWAQRFKGESVTTDDFIAVCLEGLAPEPRSLPARLAVRHRDAAHAGTSRLDGGIRSRPRLPPPRAAVPRRSNWAPKRRLLKR